MGSAEYGVEGRASIPHSALRTPHLEQGSLILIGSRDFVTVPAPRLVRLAAPDHDGGAFPDRRPSVHETLDAARRRGPHDADRLELVGGLGDGAPRRHC